MAEAELIHDICEAFQMSEASWHEADSGNSADSVLFYLAALNMVERKPFREERVHGEVCDFLEKKLEAASERRFDDLTNRLRAVLKKHEEIV